MNGSLRKVYYYRLIYRGLYGGPPLRGCFQLTLGAASDGRTEIPPVSCLTLTNGSPPINPSLPRCTASSAHCLFTLKRKGLRSRRAPRNIVCVPSCGESVFPRWRRRVAPNFSFFSRFKIVSVVFQSTLPLPLLASLFAYRSISLSPVFSLSLPPGELVFAPVPRREYSLISDIHSSPLTDGVITSSAGISAIGHDQSVRFSPRKKIAWLLLTLLINFLLAPRRIFDPVNGAGEARASRADG